MSQGYVSNGTLYVTGGLNGGNVPGNANSSVIDNAGPFSTIVVESGGSLTSRTVNSGGTLIRNSGATLNNTILEPGGNVILNSGGWWIGNVTSGLSVGSGGTFTVNSGASVTSETVQSGGKLIVNSGAIGSSVIVNSGATIYNNGGTFTNTTLKPGGNVVLNSGSYWIGNVKSDLSVASGGTITVNSGASVTSETVENGGTLLVNAGGSANAATVNKGATLTVSKGAVTSGIILNGGTVDAYSPVVFANAGVSSGTLILESGVQDGGYNKLGSGATIQVKSGASLSNSTIGNGTKLIVSAGGVISGTITVQEGGSAAIDPNAGGVVDLQGDTNGGLVISGLTSGGTVSTVISGFNGTAAGNSDSIELAGLKSADVSSVTYPSANQVALKLTNGGVVTLNIPGVESKGFTLSDGKDGWLDYEVCFLSGSMIQTPNGEVAVETLRLGDEVMAYVDGLPQSRRVVWAGKSHATVRPHLAEDEAGYPVRILKSAISEGVPHKDMLITPEHCLFFNGRFVPARMLVNGSSIFYDTSITSYDYYHVETEQHSVLCADGMLTESYLDTGNRRTFRQESAVVSLGAGRRDWVADAAVPLCVERAFVEPLFHALAARADEVFGNQTSVDAAVLTMDSDLHLVTQTGAIVRPVHHHATQYRFMLPPGVTSVRVVSHASRPSDVVGPYVDDRRMLGVAIASVQLITAHQTQSITAHLQSDKPAGWYAADTSHAWTDGNASLPLPVFEKNTMSMLCLEVCAAGPYRLADQAEQEVAAHSA